MGTTADSREPGQLHVTAVHPIGGGGPVVYQQCEIDEVDREGALRITRERGAPTPGTDPGAGASTVYAVWAPGSWQRAETVVLNGVSAP